MPIYRVTGIDRYTQRDRAAYVEAPGVRQAVDAGLSRGIVGPRAHPIDPSEVPEGVAIVRVARKVRSPRRSGRELLDRPVWTIAKGVLLGLLLWTLIVFLLRAVLLAGALGADRALGQ